MFLEVFLKDLEAKPKSELTCFAFMVSLHLLRIYDLLNLFDVAQHVYAYIQQSPLKEVQEVNESLPPSHTQITRIYGPIFPNRAIKEITQCMGQMEPLRAWYLLICEYSETLESAIAGRIQWTY
ncbi:hypothetical protein LIER_07028 [Lithospermum erythrorhizon]|uniref:Uncharacterized protein n=1 Tax=Lithospermum erythrorhizon TaxID=34254 RepID=A0AAV3P9D2_LITER